MLTQKDFDFLKIIGTGTFGKVFLARLNNGNKYFAIKMMDKQLLKENRQLDNVYNEASIMEETNICPFIVKYKNLIETDANIFLVMDYVKGGELFYYMKKYGRFPTEAVRFFTCEVIMALKFLHGKNIIYRDLKPENILVNSNGHTKLADFGFASRMNESMFLLCGTPEYMAPEKLLGNGDTKETDYWSLGCLIYEMVCGAPPYYNANTDEIYKGILTDPVVFPPEIDGSIQDLMKKLLNKEREKRLGCRGIKEIMDHPFFDGIDWNEVADLKLEPPFLPCLYQFQGPTPDLNMSQKKKAEIRLQHSYKRVFKKK